MAMKIVNKKYYKCDMNKDGEIFVEADGRRGNFKGHVVGQVHGEDKGIVVIKTKYITRFEVHGKKYVSTNYDGRSVDMKTGKKRDVTTKENIDFMLESSLNVAYNYYRKYLKERRKK